jgi:GT2 family glycosyltransferase
MNEMQTEEPKVSICIPNYNYGRFIGDAIQSALEQSYKNFELIIRMIEILGEQEILIDVCLSRAVNI